MLTTFPIFLARGISRRSWRNAFECDGRFCEQHAHMSELVTMSGTDRKQKRQTEWRKEKVTPRITQPFSVVRSTWWTADNRLVFLNGSWWRISTCEPVALQLTGDNGMKGAGRRLEGIRIYVWMFVWLNGLHSSTSVTLSHWPLSFRVSFAIYRVICCPIHK